MSLFSKIAPFQQSLDFHLERHNLLASNVAHVDTPGFRPLELERTTGTTTFSNALEVAVAKQNPAHIAVEGSGPFNGRVVEDLTAGGGADGNYVSLDREAAKLAANQLRYDLISVLVGTELRGLLSAAGDMKG